MDKEMLEAAKELEAAHAMYDNAPNPHRQDEAYHRIKAASARINAIRHERSEDVARADTFNPVQV